MKKRWLLYVGPSGTGKAFAKQAKALFVQNILRLDLSKVVSKFIGETEKSIDVVFDDAERTGSVIFLDEADALFGKRTNVRDAHDKYANQEVSYLLQKMEKHKQLIIIGCTKKPRAMQLGRTKICLIVTSEC